MDEYVAIYKCRICGITIDGKPDVPQAPWLIEYHECKNGDIGITDFQGFKKVGDSKCSMKTECIDNGKSVAVGLMEQPAININVNFMPGTEKPTVEEIANQISDMLKDEISGCLRM